MHDPRDKHIFSDQQWEFVFELRCSGYPLGELAEWLSVNTNTIRNNFRRLGLLIEERMPLSEYNKRFNELGDSDV